jgi:hypothetical protein
MKASHWLWISALLFFGASSAWLYDYRASIDAPIDFWGNSNLSEVSGRPLHAECKKFSSPGGRFARRELLADLKVKFSYMYDGVEYLGDRYSPTQRHDFHTSKECDELIRAFLNGQSVTIWVDPKNPSYAVLNPKLSLPWIGLSLMLAGGLVIAIAGGLKFFMRRAR